MAEANDRPTMNDWWDETGSDGVRSWTTRIGPFTIAVTEEGGGASWSVYGWKRMAPRGR